MWSVGLLLLGVHLACAVKHSLKYFYTGVSGDIDFPEFTAVGLVDEVQFIYFDNNTMKAVPKTEWIRENEGVDYWERETQNLIGWHQTFKNNIQIAKERFNQTQGVHTVQLMYGCELDDQTGATDAFRQFGYDGDDFLSLDFKEMRYVSPVQQGIPTVQKWNDNRAELEGRKQYFSSVCVEWLRKYLQYGKSSLKKTVSPQVSLLQKSSSSSVSCHATGFYPSGITITWKRNGQEHHEDVDLGELLPNEDGTFQKTSSITVTPEEWKNNKFSCEVEHQGETKTEDEIRTNNDSSDLALIGIIVGAAAALLLTVAGVVGFLVYRWKKASGDAVAKKTKNQPSVNSGHEPDSSSGSNSMSDIGPDGNVNSSTALLPSVDSIAEKTKSQTSVNSVHDPGYSSCSDSMSDVVSVRSDSSSDSSSADSTTALLRETEDDSDKKKN